MALGLVRPLAAAATFGVVAGSLAPVSAVPRFPPDYALHFVGYAAVALVWLLAVVWCPGQRDRPAVHARRLRAAVVLTGIIGMGVVLESAQHLVGRTAEPRDLIANVIGVAVGWAAWSRLARICALAEPRRPTSTDTSRDGFESRAIM